jgi:two-component system sensor histidine kinase RegB
MAFDTLALTALLALSGGPFNPFSFLYLVQIALAAVLLREVWTWTLAALALACSAVLFVVHRELPVPEGVNHMDFHLRGMWLAFGVTAGFIVYFLIRVTRALSARDRELAEARELASRREKLASLATLAAGAAHELATPLSTIALAAKELARHLEKSGDTVAREDALLIRERVQRCREILDQLGSDAGASAGETAAETAVEQVVTGALAGLRPAPQVRVEWASGAAASQLRVPARALAQALRSILKNAQDASPAGAVICLRVARPDGALHLEVHDQGAGMDPQVLARAGEPFFTTKPPGSGMGLGLFLSRTVVEQLGGHLAIESTAKSGTTVTVVLPDAQAATPAR